MLPDLPSGFLVMDAIQCLIETKKKYKIPRWIYVLDYTLTMLYLAVFIGVIVIVLLHAYRFIHWLYV
jgi:hypothetical protein